MQDGRKKILIIDDSSVTLGSVSHMLGSKYKVFCANSGLKAIEIITMNPPDLIFLDFKMPELDGKDTYEVIKQFPGMEDVPIVFLTSMADSDCVKELLRLRPAGYLLKPPLPFRVLEVAKKYLE